MAAATGNERRPADTRRCAVTCSWYDVDERRRWRHDIVTFLLLLYYGTYGDFYTAGTVTEFIGS